jgi:hypothetical protein
MLRVSTLLLDVRRSKRIYKPPFYRILRQIYFKEQKRYELMIIIKMIQQIKSIVMITIFSYRLEEDNSRCKQLF